MLPAKCFLGFLRFRARSRTPDPVSTTRWRQIAVPRSPYGTLRRVSQTSVRATLAAGALAGCVAAVPMTAVMLVLQRLLPLRQRYPLPPAQVTRRLAARFGLGRHTGSGEWSAPVLASHFAYGTAGGAVYALGARAIPLPPAVGGAAYGLAVWLASYLGWLPAFGVQRSATEQPNRRRMLMIAAHLVWGVTLDVALRGLLSRPNFGTR